MTIRPREGVKVEFSTSTAGTAGETACWVYNVGEKWDGTSIPVICLHGHGTVGQDAPTPLQFAPDGLAGRHLYELVKEGGFVGLSLQAGGAASWGKPSVYTAIVNAAAAAVTRGCRPGKVAAVGYSMGAFEWLNMLKLAASMGLSIGALWLWAALPDLDYARSTAGHDPVAGNPTWTTEIDTAFGSYAATAGYRIWDEPQSFRGLKVPTRIAHAIDDATIPFAITKKFVEDVNDPSIRLYKPDLTGGHTGLFPNVPYRDFVGHFRGAFAA